MRGKCGGCLRACLPCSICCAYTAVLLVLLPCMEKGDGGKVGGGTRCRGGVRAATPTQLGYNYTKNTWHRPAYIRALQPVPDVYRRTHMTAPVSFLSHVEHAYMHAWTYTIVISFFPCMYVTKAHVSPYMYFLFFNAR